MRPQKKKSKAAMMTTEEHAMVIPAMAPVERPSFSLLVPSLSLAVPELMGVLLDSGLSGGNGSPGLSM